MTPNFKKILLIVLDGFGIASAAAGNAVTRAGMKTFDSLVDRFPALALQTAGPNVGLPWGEPGNSEVGHMCLGAGRIVLQDLPRIDQAITNGEFYKNSAFLKAIDHAKENNSALHLVGLLGDGSVHASQFHLHALLTLAAARDLNRVFIHVITDGRDTAPDAALDFLKTLEKKILELGVGKVATLTGRFYAMDRAGHWDLTELAYQAMVEGKGERAQSPLGAIEKYYEQSIYDETLSPTVIVQNGNPVNKINTGDSVIFYNFRADRALQLTQALVDPANTGFAKKYPKLDNLLIATMTEFSNDLPVWVAFPKLLVPHVLSEVISSKNKKQLHIAESEKFSHVTYFFNNGREQPFKNEYWEEVKSSSQYKERYQNVPQMSAPELTLKVLEKLKDDFDFILVNYANPDMVGHTANLPACIKALQTVDNCLGQITKYVLDVKDVLVIITADHGTVEGVQEIRSGRIHKAHTTNPVPFLLIGEGLGLKTLRKTGYLYLATQVPEGLLSDVAPTILEVFGIKQPPEMTGVSLLANLLKQIQ